jgi:hypothetical protein
VVAGVEDDGASSFVAGGKFVGTGNGPGNRERAGRKGAVEGVGKVFRPKGIGRPVWSWFIMFSAELMSCGVMSTSGSGNNARDFPLARFLRGGAEGLVTVSGIRGRVVPGARGDGICGASFWFG